MAADAKPTDPRSALSKVDPHSLSPAVSAHLDLVRALAAWVVMWCHLRGLFFNDFQGLSGPGPFVKTIYFFTGFGHQAVIVFFVLSGFLISSAIMKRQASGTWSWGDYAIDRSSRLYAVLIPGLLFGFLWDKTGSSFFAASGIYARPLAAFGNVIPVQELTVRNFAGNLFFLQTIVCSTFGSNGPLWSLANEFWYYALFPLGLLALIAWTKSAQPALQRAIPLTALALLIAAFVGPAICLDFLIWLAGWALVFAYAKIRLRSILSRVLYLLISGAVLAVALVDARMSRLPTVGTDVPLGLAFALFLFGVLQFDFGPPQFYRRAAHFFAGFSYSLYVLHLPFLLFLRAWITPLQRWQPDAAHLALAILLGSVAIAFAWLVSLFTENKTRDLRAWLRRVTVRG